MNFSHNRLNLYITVSAILLISAIPSSAQFYTFGNDPGRLKWYKAETPHYKIIYPQGLDSLANIYGIQLERYRNAESVSSGMAPGEGHKRKLPVILHAYNGISNAAVTWAPKRLDIFTLPDMYDPEPMPWEKTLAIHENRHIAQMQLGYKGWLKPLTILLGDMAPGAYSAIWPSTWMLEGDAVVAETALTNAGRGRNADFLEYYRTAFSEGDYRNWYSWRYGSYRHYSPDHYALGYLTIAGIRYCFKDSLYTQRYFSRIQSNPFRFFNTQKTIRMASGMPFNKSFDVITSTFNEIWEEDKSSRAPFITSERLSGENNWYTLLKGSVVCNGKIYAIRSGIAESAILVEIDPDTGKETELRAFSNMTGRLSESNGKLLWSETIPDARWSLKMSSVIRSYDLKTGKTRTLTRKGKIYNPVVSDDGKAIAAISSPVTGGTELILINVSDSNTIKKLTLPGSLQASEVCFIDNFLYFNAVSDKGIGIYRICANLEGELETVIEPVPAVIRNLKRDGEDLCFACDRTGTNEYYRLHDSCIYQITSLENGGAEFCADGDYLYYTVQSGEDKMLHRTSRSDLFSKKVDFNELHKYKVADELSYQERALAQEKNISIPDDMEDFDVEISDSRRYRKSGHIFRIHSWAPVYFNYDKIMSMSSDLNYETASAGATILLQNDLGTAWGSAGYSYHKDPYFYLYGDKMKHRHSGHINFSYSGLYPVFELSADFNDRAAIQYSHRIISNQGINQDNISGTLRDKPYMTGKLKAYIPFNFSSGGWQRGLIPQIEYSIGNDYFDKSKVYISYNESVSGKQIEHFIGYEKGKNILMQEITTSLRGYMMRPTAASEVYPQYGIGFETGYSTRTALNDVFTSSFYGYLYGYLPGITKTQGLRVSGIYQHQQSQGVVKENKLDPTPRGFKNSGAEYYMRSCSRNQLRISADYAIPIWVGDISWFSPLFYIKNFEVTPHCDFTMFSEGKSITDGNLISAGVKLIAKLGNLLWIPYDCGIGITVDWNGGSSFGKIKNSGYQMDNHYIGFVFNMSL